MAKNNRKEATVKRIDALRAAFKAVIRDALKGFKRPFKLVGTEVGEFISINGRKGKLAYVVADVNGKTFKVGLTQMKQLNVKVPAIKK